MIPLLALWERPISTWGFLDFAKLVIIIVAACAIVYVACKAMGWIIPRWLIDMVVILVVAICAIIALTLIGSM